MTVPIDRFSGEYAFLSNFAPSLVTMDGLTYPTVEHAFQAAKTLDHTQRAIILHLPTPGAAKAQGRRVKLRPNWEDIKIGVMRDLIGEKFAPGTELAAKLMATGDAQLIEGNHWGDRFWGCTQNAIAQWVGLNWLGELLMRQREALQGR